MTIGLSASELSDTHRESALAYWCRKRNVVTTAVVMEPEIICKRGSVFV
jgi:hypothetical protein